MLKTFIFTRFRVCREILKFHKDTQMHTNILIFKCIMMKDMCHSCWSPLLHEYWCNNNLHARAKNLVIDDKKHYCRSTTTFSNGSTQAEGDKEIKILNFRKLLDSKVKQADNSVIFEITSEKSIFSISEYLTQFFEIKNKLYYTTPSGKNFLLVELCSAEAVWNLLHKCKCITRNGRIQNFCRIIKFNDSLLDSTTITGSKNNVSAACSTVKEVFKSEAQDNITPTFSTVSNPFQERESFSAVDKFLEDYFHMQRLNEEAIALRFFLCSVISNFLRGIFHHCKIVPFGSSLNGFGSKSSDLDAVILPYGYNEECKSKLLFNAKHPKQYAHREQQILKTIGNILLTFLPGVTYVDYVYQTKAPLVKFHHDSFGLECDLNSCNMYGLKMTELLFYCGNFDPRVRPLAFAVKHWAKKANITSDITTQSISNFSLILLLVFFLQTRAHPVLPPLYKLCEALDIPERENEQFLRLNYSFSNQESMGDLLKEFFVFIKNFDFKKRGISVHQGKFVKKLDYNPIFIENPLNPELNVSHNVTKNSFNDLQSAAECALYHFEFLRKRTEVDISDFWNILSSTENK